MKGERLHLTLFGSEPVVEADDDAGRGRSAELIEQRNARLIARYFFYSYYKKKFYPEIIGLLKTEFDLSLVTLPQVLRPLLDTADAWRRKPPSVESFREQWDWMVWK